MPAVPLLNSLCLIHNKSFLSVPVPAAGPSAKVGSGYNCELTQLGYNWELTQLAT